MLEIGFYHLTRRRLDDMLPTLLEKSLKRRWRVGVQAVSAARLKKLDDWLWAYKPEGFLPHGRSDDADPSTLPIYLTCERDNPNGADMRFFVEGALLAPALDDASSAPKLRAALIFDSADQDELLNARAQWKELRANDNYELHYYQETDEGGFVERGRDQK